MSVGIYTSAVPEALLSQDGAFTSPFSVTFDGRIGGNKQYRLFVRNDNSLFWYSNLSLTLSDSGSESIINNSQPGFLWKLSAGDTQPTENAWLNIAASNTINLPNLGIAGNPNIATYLPFWVLIQVPANLNVQNFNTVRFVLSGQENLI